MIRVLELVRANQVGKFAKGKACPATGGQNLPAKGQNCTIATTKALSSYLCREDR